MTSTPSNELGQPEDKTDYQVTVDDVERGQVARRWTHAMGKYGVEARGRLSCLRQLRFRYSIGRLRHSPRPAGTQNGYTVQQDLFYLVLCEL